MIKRHRRATRVHTDTPIKRPLLSTNIWIALVATIGIAGCFVGTNSSQIFSYIGPIFGQRYSAQTLDLSSLQETYKVLTANFDGTLDDKTLIEGANKGLVDAAGDQYTVFMNEEQSNDFQDELSGTIGGGIGAEISMRNDHITIIRVLKDNPAIKVGLQAGDRVLSINDQSTDDMTVDQAVSQIRGDEGTTVKLSIQRGTEVKEFTVTRAIINNPSVESSVTGDVGTLTISRFDSETSTLARAAATDFKNQNVTAIILDLRGNGGGYVDAAQDVAGLWLDNQVVVTERTNGKVVDTLKSGRNPILAGIPTVVLINGGSASASEIVAGALQDHKAATLVGDPTFGKGTVQKIIELMNGAQLKVTIARWYTPNGKNITNGGIAPDIQVTLTQADLDDGKDPQIEAARKQVGL